MHLTNKVCLVTGGTSGIGAATSRLLLLRGAAVMAVGRSKRHRAIHDLSCTATSNASRFEFFQTDVSTLRGCDAAVEETLKRFERIDAIVHCAGGAVPGTAMNVGVEQWMLAFDVHVHAIFHLARKAVPNMRERREGAIVLVSSVAGRRGVSGAAAYAVVKGALPQFSRVLARELADDNIRVNCVSPGVIRTPFQDFLTPQQVKNNIENRIPLHCEGTPDNVAEVIVQLMENSYVTGEEVVVDGGLSMRIA